jgi:hypothetical protein
MREKIERVVERYYHGPPQYDCCEGPATTTACKSGDATAASRSAESLTIGTGVSSDNDTEEAEQVMPASIHLADLLVLRL